MNVGFGTPFQEQIDYLVKKLRLPSERWDDIQRSAHDRAFMVAGAAQADLLKDLHDAVVKAAQQGLGLSEFRKDFKAAVAKHGWTGWTGEGTKDGEAWRTKVIYQTNMAQSYWAGRYRQMSDPQVLKLRPYWRYIHSDGVANPRPHHLAWHGLTLKADHPFWQTHFAPNGWGCRCRIEAVSKREGEASAAAGLDDLPADWDAVDPKTGTVAGIDKGFDYAPGAGVNASMRSLVEAKLIKLPPKLADALRADMDRLDAMASPGSPTTTASTPKFVEAKTAKAAAQWAMDNNLADFADYTGVKPEVANAWNQSLFEHLQEFPELRKNQRYTGTAQGQFKRYAEVKKNEYVATLVSRGLSEADARALAELRIKTPKVKSTTYAQSWAQKEAQGIAVNAVYGSDLGKFNAALKRDVINKWHPVGCDTIRSVVDHELGHQLDDLLGLRLDTEVINAYKSAKIKGMNDEVSGYADTKITEFIAECWAESLNNPNPRDAARTVANIARQRYQSRFP